MDFYTPVPNRRHNPVDSICRKLQTIQWRGDREPNSPFQIPKVSTSSYDSPQSGLRHNLEAILNKGAHREEGKSLKGKAMGAPNSAASQRSHMSPSPPLSTPFTPAFSLPTPTNVTYTITSTLGERRGADGSDIKPVKKWQRYCSTPTVQSKESPYFTFTRGPQSVQPESEGPSRNSSLSRTFTPKKDTLSYDLNFCSADRGNLTECELPYPALVVKRLSMGDGGSSLASENRKENMSEISLICEENLLDTIFHACDTQRRGKVYVSHIVDYLRHTTSRSSEDSGLEELCNMLDPEHKDVSIDLDTYHAVMREWIDDCRNNGEETTDDVTQDSVKLKDSLAAKRSMLLNLTSGSLEAFGGDASRAEFETSELVYCVTDLQMSNQKLQEEVKKLKQVVENMEDSNQKLLEENEELRNQARVNQQLAQKEKMLKEEVEEMKATLNCTEEGRARASAHSIYVEKENQNLIAKIASLQEENFKVTMEMEDFQRRIAELCHINADLQVQIHSFDAIVSEKEAVILERGRQINELKSAVEEYSSITELLRADKNKLENQMKMMHPDLTGAGLSLSVAYRLNQSTSGSLQTELALAQSPLEHDANHLSSMSLASPLDETLDREVLLMMQGPSPEYMAQEFKNTLNNLKKDFTEEGHSVMSTVRGLLDDHAMQQCRDSLQKVQSELDKRGADWALSLDQLAQYTDSLEKELIKMASNMRRSRTEILHLSVRVQEQENKKRQLCEELEQRKTPHDSREASCQTPAPEEKPGDNVDWDEEFALQDFLKTEWAERSCRGQCGRTDNRSEEKENKLTDGVEEEEKWTVVDTGGGEGEARDTSTPLSAFSGAAGGGQDSAVCVESEPEENFQCLQKEAAVPSSAHLQAVGISHAEADTLPALSHIGTNKSSFGPDQNISSSWEQDQTFKLNCTHPITTEMVPPDCTSPGPDETVTKSESTQLTSEDQGGEGKEGKLDLSAGILRSTKSLSQESGDESAAEDNTCLLPVLEEEEEENTVEAPTEANIEGSEEPATSSTTHKPLEAEVLTSIEKSEGSSPQSQPPVTYASQSQSGMDGVTSDTSVLEDSATKTDSFLLCDKNKKELELPHSTEAAEEQSESNMATEKESETSFNSDISDANIDGNGMSPSDKEVEAEFQRLALGFKCDMFTLEKRLRLEERSRDLAEENVRREVSSCQGLLQALIPLCEDDNQSMEIIQRLQKNLDILTQSMIRVSSRSEMLGAIHQENRIGKAVEVMIQHVENLRRMYTKEHAELLELRETLMQNERSFGSQTERDDFRGKKQPTSQYYKSSARRVSIAAIPRSHGGNMNFDMSKTQDGSEAEMERLTRRPPCPSSSSGLTSTDTGLAQCLSQGLVTSRAAAVVARGGRGLWLWLAMVVMLAGLLALLASLVMQPVVDAAPVGTGDSWMTIQQLLWPYAGLRHNGQPPI